MKLNQGVALLKTAMSDGEGALTRAYHDVQKTPLLAGFSKSYSPRDEEGEQLPSELNRLQLRVPEIISDAVPPLIRLIDLTATVDLGNQVSKADVVDPDNGEVILHQVPISTLLWLERKLKVFSEFITKIPTLDAAEEWVDGDDGLSFKTVPASKVRTKKVPRVLEKSPATDKHAAQVELLHEDVVVGDWHTTIFSGAITQKRKRALAAKLSKLQQAVKIAREEANSIVITDLKYGEDIFKYLGWAE